MRRMKHALAVVGMTIMVVAAGCKPTGSEQGAAPAPEAPVAATAEVVDARPVVHPCALLTDASVALAVADAQAGQHVDDDEYVGISTCRWPAGDDAVVLQVFDAGPGSLPHELRASSLDLVEMRRPDAASVVRIEQFTGVGDQSAAYVERLDSKRGIRKSSAVLMVQKANRLAVLRIPQLASGDREKALASMKVLGVEIAAGL